VSQEVFGRTLRFLARDEDGRQVVTALVKRTFALDPREGLSPCEEQAEFVEEDELVPKETEPGAYPVAESEVVPFKLKTDVVVTGEVVAHHERPVPESWAGVEVGNHRKYVRVFGDRLIHRMDGNRLRFSEPEPFTRLPLTWDRAYGGVDPSVPRNEDPGTVEEWLEYLTLVCHPGVYPRNPVGRAYTVNPHAWMLEERPLPNFEDPDDLLTPERIVVGDPRHWWAQPLPAGLGWFGRAWYPRAVLGGLMPPFPPEQASVREVRMGWLPPDHLSRGEARTLDDGPDLAFFNGASPGLALPRLRGDEPMRLLGFHPEGERRFALPGVVPDIRMAFRGNALTTSTHLHTLWVRADEDRVWMVWSGTAPTPERLPLTLPTREKPEIDELEGVDVWVDGVKLPHETVDLGTAHF